jgi:dihydroxyacetone kinase DhaKLM complex PTS-EIIA-like component DhaM
MADTSYSFNINTSFPNHTVNTVILSNEIIASSIIETLLRIDTDSGICYVWFNNALTGGDQTLLNNIVAAHTGQALPADGYKSGTNRAPTINDDISGGFYVGYVWLDTLSDQEYVCFDNADGAAIWKQTTNSNHSSTHLNGAQDQIDGYNLNLNYTSVNYSQPSVNTIGQHISNIDQKLVNNTIKYTVGPIGSGAAYNTIQSAVNQAEADIANGLIPLSSTYGSPITIEILNGNYTENIVCNISYIAFNSINQTYSASIAGNITFNCIDGYNNLLSLNNISVSNVYVNSTAATSINISVDNCKVQIIDLSGINAAVSPSTYLFVEKSKIINGSGNIIVTNGTIGTINLTLCTLTGSTSGSCFSASSCILNKCRVTGRIQTTTFTRAYYTFFTTSNQECILTSGTSAETLYECAFIRTGTSGPVVIKNGSSVLTRFGNTFSGTVSNPPIVINSGTDSVGNFLETKFGPYTFPNNPTNIFTMPSSDGSSGNILLTNGSGVLSLQDGYDGSLTYAPVNYNSPAVQTIGQHIAAIDKSININRIKYTVGSIESGAQFQTIQSAINRAQLDGASTGTPVQILIFAGTYNENITISSPNLSLVGIGSINYSTYINGNINLNIVSGYDNYISLKDISSYGNVIITGTAPIISIGIANCNINRIVATAATASSYFGLNLINSFFSFYSATNEYVIDSPNSNIAINNCSIYNDPSGIALNTRTCTIFGSNISGRVDVSTTGNLKADICKFETTNQECIILNSNSLTDNISNCSFLRNGTSGYIITKNGSNTLNRVGNSFFGSALNNPINIIGGSSISGNVLETRVGPYTFPNNTTNIFNMPSSDGLSGNVLITNGLGSLSLQDGYNSSLTYSPINYNIPSSNTLGQHIHQIDKAIGNATDGYDLAAIFENQKDPTGFQVRTTSVISVNNGTRTLSIAPVSGSYQYLRKGNIITKTGTDSVIFPDVEGTHFFYFNELDQLSTVNTTGISDVILNQVMVAVIYWDSVNNLAILIGDERHGLMDGRTHLHFHLSFGAQWYNGGSLGDIIVDGDGSLATQSQLSVSSVEYADEDIRFVVSHGNPQQLNFPAEIPVYYRLGTNGDWRKKNADTYPLIYSGTAGYTGANGRLPFNEWTGSTWQLTQITNNNFVLVHYFGMNDINTPICAIHGQNEYSTINDARAGAEVEIANLAGTAQLLGPEFVKLGTVIFQSSNGFTNVPRAIIRSTDTGDSYIDFRGVSIRGGGASTTDHGNLSGLSDDDHTQYLLTNGTRSMTGSLNIGGFNITNVGTVDGYNLETQFQTITNHITNTANPHATSIANIGSGTLAQLNSAISDADLVPTTRTLTAGNGLTGGGDLSSNRTIDITAGDTSITVNADSIQVGVISDANHGTRGGAALHSAATTSVNGFMSSTDKTKLDGIQSGAQVNPNIWSVFSDGTNTASPGTTSDTFRFRSANNILTTVVGSNDGTYGDNLLLTITQTNIDHGSIGGLSDDDHTQYLLVNGTRSMSSSLNMGTFNITNVGTVDGYNLETQFQTITNHITNTSNPHATSIANIGSGTLAQLNSAISDADVVSTTRTITAGNGLTGGGDLSSDRTINIVAADSSITVNADSIQVGTITDANHGSRSGGTLHSTVTNTLAGFIPAVGANNTIPQSNGTGIAYVSELTNPQKITVARAGADIGSRSRINFIEGTNVTITTTDNSGSGRVDVTIAATGSGGLDNAYASMYDGTTTAAASGSDTFRFRSANSAITTVIGSNDATYGDNLLITLVPGNIAHSSLGSLTSSDDHTQYVHNTTARTITAVHTFNPGSATAPFTLGTNALNQLITGLNSDRLDGQEGSYYQNADNLNSGTLPAARFNDTSHGSRSGGNLHSTVSNTAAGFVPSVGLDGYILQSNGSASVWRPLKRIISMHFILSEDVTNTELYFLAYRSAGSDITTGKRSGDSGGFNNANACSPILVPFNATIIKASLALRGAGVQNGSVTYPVTYQTRLDEVGFTTVSTIGNLNWSISNAYTVGTYSPADTRFKGSITSTLQVSEGQMLGLKFINGTGASLVGQMRNAVISLVLEER